MAVYLLVRYKNEEKKLPLSDKPLVFGRADDCDITLKDDGISSNHCSIQISNDSIWVKDNDSKNGTRINNEEITRKKLYINEIIQIGEIFMEISKEDLTTIEKKFLTNKNQKKNKQGIDLSLPTMSSKNYEKETLVTDDPMGSHKEITAVTEVVKESLLKKIRKKED